jgi:regulator of protease activity HflC (stomatin/prohibitin superfamily)
VAILFALAALGMLGFTAGARLLRQDIGHVGVVRNGGPFNNRAIRQILLPGAGLTWAGWFSQKPHEYPARGIVLLYGVTADPSRGHRPGIDVVTVPSRDGVQIGIEGTVYYHFVGESNPEALKQFDRTFGSRRYSAHGGPAYYPYEGDAGFQAMIENVFRPILDDDLRREAGAFECAAIVTACTVVRPASGRPSKQGSTKSTAMIQGRINRSLEDDLAGALGGHYFVDVHFRITRVTLPGNVQTAVDRAQAESAQVRVARERLRQGYYEARRNELLAKVYNKSPSLANINAIRAAPRQSTVIINTGRGQQPLILGAK